MPYRASADRGGTTIATDSAPAPPAPTPTSASAIRDRAALADFDPHWSLFWARSTVASQFSIWRPYLGGSRNRWLVVARNGGTPDDVRAAIEAMPNVRYLEATDDSIRWLKGARSFKGFLYVQGFKAATFLNVNTFRHHSHIWVAHGDSEKLSSSPRSASIYDSVFVASYRSVKRFPRAIRPWISRGACAIGAPIVAGIQPDPWTAPRPVRTLLYAPTWEGYSPSTDYSSISDAAPALTGLMPQLTARGIRLIVRPHPRTGRRLPGHAQAIDELVAAGAVRSSDKATDFAAADVMLSDVSGVTGEWLFTQKPAILPFSRSLAVTGKTSGVLAREYPWMARWDVEGGDLMQAIDAIESDDPLRAARAKEAATVYRGHHSVAEAVRTFDLALSVVGYSRTRIHVRWAFEARRRFGWLPDDEAAKGLLRRFHRR